MRESEQDITKKMWKECAVLAAFMAEYDESLSKETRNAIARRISAIIEGINAVDNPPLPF